MDMAPKIPVYSVQQELPLEPINYTTTVDREYLDGTDPYSWLDRFSRNRLSKHFFMRDFLYCSYNDANRIPNLPEDPAMVLTAGRELCGTILEPIVEKFGRVLVTFGYQCREGLEAASPANKKNPKSSSPHQWDRGTFGKKIYARVDIMPLAVMDGHVDKHTFGLWCMDNLNIDLLMMWHHSNVFCITISPKPRMVFLQWVPSGKGEFGSNKITIRGENYWMNEWPNLPPSQKPKYGPSVTGGKMFWS